MLEEIEAGARDGDISSHQIPSRVPRKTGQHGELIRVTEPKLTPASTPALPPVSSRISEGPGAVINPEATGCTAIGNAEKKPAEAAATAWAPRHTR